MSNPIYSLSQWLYCSWAHKKHRCYPEVNKINPTAWHCEKCHPCGEGVDEFLETYSDGWHFRWELDTRHLWIGCYWEIWRGEETNRLDCFIGGPLLVLRIIRVWSK